MVAGIGSHHQQLLAWSGQATLHCFGFYFLLLSVFLGAGEVVDEAFIKFVMVSFYLMIEYEDFRSPVFTMVCYMVL